MIVLASLFACTQHTYKHTYIHTQHTTFLFQFHNIQWICSFGRLADLSPEQALALDLRDPAAFLASAAAPHTPDTPRADTAADGQTDTPASPSDLSAATVTRERWSAGEIMAGYDTFVREMEDLNECLGDAILEV